MADGKQGAQEAWRSYLELALGLTEASKKKAQDVAMRLAGRGGATAQQLQTLADHLFSTSLANRETLTKLVRFEVDRAISAVGLASADEVAKLRERIADLERQLHAEKTPRGASVSRREQAAGVSEVSAAGTSATKRTTTKRTAPKKAAAKRTAAPPSGTAAE